jgi:hypothetical protein
MCSHSDVVSVAVGEEVFCEEVVKTILAKQLPISGLVAQGFDLNSLTNVPNWVGLADDKQYALQILTCVSQLSDSYISDSLQTAISRCNSTLQSQPAPKIQEKILVSARG